MKTVLKLRRLNHVKRCALFPVLHPTSVAEHSFHTSLLVLFLIEELKKEGRQIDELKALKLAVLHDTEEIIVSDVPYTVKLHLEDKFDVALSNMISDDLPDAPEWLVKAMTAKGDGSLEYKILKVADLWELALYCIDEMELGNRNVREMLVKSIEVCKTPQSLCTALSETADFYNKSFASSFQKKTILLEVFLLMFLGLTIGWLVISMYLPIFSMAGAIV